MSSEKLNSQEYALKLYEMLKPSGWHDLLKGFLLSEDFTKIITTLEECVTDGKRFTPPLRQVFNAFIECPLKDTKVIILGQEPYPQIHVADGKAFSCGNTNKPEASLRYIFKAINTTVYEGKADVAKFDPNLGRWSKQGVLLLNTALTTEIGKIGKHYDIWQPFITYLVDMLNNNEKVFTWVFMGKKAQELEDLVDDILNDTKILKCSHPASAAYSKESNWDCNDVFNKINTCLKQQGKTNIIW